MLKYIYDFSEGNMNMRSLLGGKGANLAEMTNIGLPVPPGFTITTDVCNEYYKIGKEKVVERLQDEVKNAVAHVESFMHSRLGDVENPLLVSVRSGARASMPGMMDTILNLGLNDEVVEGLARKTNNPRFAWDSYRRGIGQEDRQRAFRFCQLSPLCTDVRRCGTGNETRKQRRYRPLRENH